MGETDDWTVISQGILQQPCKALEWCPSGDLFAVINSQGTQVQLIRLKGQRVWTVTSSHLKEFGELQFVTLAWRPDGKILVIGTDNGTALLCDITDGKIIFDWKSDPDSKEPKVAVTFIKWVEEISSVRQNMQSTQRAYPRTTDFLPKLKAYKRQESSSTVYANGHDLGENVDRMLNIAVVGTADSHVSLLVFGTFLIGTLSLGKDVKLLHHCSTKDLRRQALIVQQEDKLVLANLRIADLQSDEVALRDITAISYVTNMLISFLDSSLNAMKLEWNLAENAHMGHIASLKALTTDYESEVPLQSLDLELLDVLMCGLPIEPIREWILTKLTRRGVERWQKARLDTYETLRAVTQQNILSACERIILELEELQGLTYKMRLLAQGQLHENLADPCMEILRQLFHNIFSFFKALKLEKHRFQEFTSWMLSVVTLLESMSETPPSNIPEPPPYKHEAVADFLQYHFLRSPLGDYLGREHELEVEQGVDTSEPDATDHKAQLFDNLLQDLRKKHEQAFEQPQSLLTSKFAIDNLLPLHHFRSNLNHEPRIRIWPTSYKSPLSPTFATSTGFSYLVCNVDDDSLDYSRITLNTQPPSVLNSTKILLLYNGTSFTVQDFEHIGNNRIVGLGHLKGIFG